MILTLVGRKVGVRLYSIAGPGTMLKPTLPPEARLSNRVRKFQSLVLQKLALGISYAASFKDALAKSSAFS